MFFFKLIGFCFVDMILLIFFLLVFVSYDNGYLIVFWNVGSFKDLDDLFFFYLKVVVGKIVYI